MNKSELRKYIIEVMSENKYAICTASIAKTAGTTGTKVNGLTLP